LCSLKHLKSKSHKTTHCPLYIPGFKKRAKLYPFPLHRFSGPHPHLRHIRICPS
jgi:hypothetical protein